MSDITRVALDAMGGDHAPAEMVKGAIEAVNKSRNQDLDMESRSTTPRRLPMSMMPLDA